MKRSHPPKARGETLMAAASKTASRWSAENLEPFMGDWLKLVRDGLPPDWYQDTALCGEKDVRESIGMAPADYLITRGLTGQDMRGLNGEVPIAAVNAAARMRENRPSFEEIEALLRVFFEDQGFGWLRVLVRQWHGPVDDASPKAKTLEQFLLEAGLCPEAVAHFLRRATKIIAKMYGIG